MDVNQQTELTFTVKLTPEESAIVKERASNIQTAESELLADIINTGLYPPEEPEQGSRENDDLDRETQ